MRDQFQTPAMVKILLAQRDVKGAVLLAEKLRREDENSSLDEGLLRELKEALAGARQEMIRTLENWLRALRN